MSHDEHSWCADRMPAYRAEDLSDEDRTRVEAHVPGCVACASQLQEVQPVELDPEPDLRWRDRWVRSVARFRPGSLVLRGVLAAAATVLLGIVGYVLAEFDPAASSSLAAEALDEMLAAASASETGLSVGHRRGFSPERGDAASSAADVLSFIQGQSIGVGAGGAGAAVLATESAQVVGRYGGRFERSEGYSARGGGSFAGAFRPTEAAHAFREEEPVPKRQSGATIAVTTAAAAPAQDEAPRRSQKIIRSGEMDFEIDSFDSTVATLTKIVAEEEGFLATFNSEKLQNGKVRGVVVVRVPPEHLDTLLLKLRALGDLKSQRIGSDDVTKTYLDLESRLRAARTMEERLIAIIRDGKGEIKDLLQAEKELGEWRTKIETMVGEINYYNTQIAHSTVTITLFEKEFRAPFGLLETEHVELGLEVEDVEKAYGEALSAIAEAQGRVSRSELKQLGQGQFNAVLQFEAAPSAAGPLRDRLKQVGVMARLDINRSQELQGGSGPAKDAKVHQNDTQFLVSLYNLVNVAPRETVQVTLACKDTEKSYQAILERVEKVQGRILSSTLTRQKADLSTGHLQFQVKVADAEAVLQDIRGSGEILKLDVREAQDPPNATRTKRGFSVDFLGLGTVQPRETSTIVVAAKDVAAGYHLLAAAAKGADARVLAAALNEDDRRNRTATLSIEIRREAEAAIAEAIGKAGDVYTRNSTRSQDTETVTDSKVLLHFRLFDASNIPARETVKLSVEVGDVEGASKRLESEYKGRLVDARHTRDAGGRRESTMTIDVPLKEAAGAVERLKALGAVLDHVSTKNAGVPENELALARVEIKVSNEVLVGRDSGPLASLKRGLAVSLQAASWALMFIMIGVCFVGPLLLFVWAGLKLRRRFAAKPAEAPAAAA